MFEEVVLKGNPKKYAIPKSHQISIKLNRNNNCASVHLQSCVLVCCLILQPGIHI